VRNTAVAAGFLARLTKNVGDGGVNVVVKDAIGQITHLIQCKHTKQLQIEIDRGLSTDLPRMRSNWGAKDAQILGVTNASNFSQTVKRIAEIHCAQLISRNQLVDFSKLLK
jgi:hypothetical protein